MNIEERTLIDQAIGGDADAFGELVRLHQNRLFNAILHVVGCPAEAEDVVQEAFIRAFRRLDRFQGTANFYTWLYRIAMNRSVDRRRTRRPTCSLESERRELMQKTASDAHGPSHPMELREQNQRVQHALAQLPESERAILILREFEEFDYATISDMLGLKVGTVRSRLHRARSHLLDTLRRLDSRGELPSGRRAGHTRLKTRPRTQNLNR